MFTGIVKGSSVVESLRRSNNGMKLTIHRPATFRILKKGRSIAVNGVCLTLTAFTRTTLRFDCAPQTLRVTTLGALRLGECVNLERPVSVGQELGGHFVTGHVDAVAIVQSVRAERGHELTIEVPRQLSRFCPERGSITLNGVSLTIAHSKGRAVTVALIPFTLKETNLGTLKKGDTVNVEVDLIARYVQSFAKS